MGLRIFLSLWLRVLPLSTFIFLYPPVFLPWLWIFFGIPRLWVARSAPLPLRPSRTPTLVGGGGGPFPKTFILARKTPDTIDFRPEGRSLPPRQAALCTYSFLIFFFFYSPGSPLLSIRPSRTFLPPHRSTFPDFKVTPLL